MVAYGLTLAGIAIATLSLRSLNLGSAEVALAVPDLFGLFVVFVGMFGKKRTTALPASVLAAGILKDVLSVGPLGGFTLLYWVAYREVAARRHRIFRDKLISQFLVALAAIAFVQFAQAFAMKLLPHPPRAGELALQVVRIAACSAFLAPILFTAFRLSLPCDRGGVAAHRPGLTFA